MYKPKKMFCETLKSSHALTTLTLVVSGLREDLTFPLWSQVVSCYTKIILTVTDTVFFFKLNTRTEQIFCKQCQLLHYN